MQNMQPETDPMTATHAAALRPAMPAALRFMPLGWLRDSLLWLAVLQRRHRERMQLSEMNEAALKDIGLSRCDMMAECAKPRWRR
jgi:uncharacterized protein YjiS (DUF1127 family)